MSLITLRNVSKFYEGAEPVRALDGVSISVDEGEFVAVMGASGSGKTTMLTVLGGLNRPTAGEVAVDGIDIYGLSSDRQADFRRNYLGFVFQEHQLLPHLTARENVLLAVSAGSEEESATDAALETLYRVGLADKAHRLPGQLSGGEQARVAIARALVRKPAIILADEPTGNLDSHTGREILTLLQSLNAHGQTIVLVTHNEQAAKAATRLVRVCDGKIVSDEVLGGRPAAGSAGNSLALAGAREGFVARTKPNVSLMQTFFSFAMGSIVLIFLALVWLTLGGDLGH